MKTSMETLTTYEAKWSHEAALRREAEEEAEAAGIPWDDYSNVEEWGPNIITWDLGATGSYRRD